MSIDPFSPVSGTTHFRCDVGRSYFWLKSGKTSDEGFETPCQANPWFVLHPLVSSETTFTVTKITVTSFTEKHRNRLFPVIFKNGP